MIRSVKRGLYAVNFGGGQVDITSGKFVFSASEAYLIEDGKVTAPVKGATLIGNGPDALTKVTMVGNDMALDPGIGICGKNGQGVPVGVGQPTLKMSGPRRSAAPPPDQRAAASSRSSAGGSSQSSDTPTTRTRSRHAAGRRTASFGVVTGVAL